ncbi:MAG: hypothetical protein AB7F88_12775 [Pyrinomonadaceae bacterium]
MRTNRIVSSLGPALLIAVFLLPILGQKTSSCRIGTTAFSCPQGFVKLPDVDAEIRLFRLKESDDPLFVFVAVPSGGFVDTPIKKAIEKHFSGVSSDEFQWKLVKNPLVMDINTKYERTFVASFGYWDRYLLELKYFTFSVKDKKIHIGYASNIGEAPWLNKALFEKGEGVSDTAVGCNAVATLLNSITKEFKEKGQNCTISAIGLK